MKRAVLFFLIVFLVHAYSCKQLENAPFNVNYTTSLTIPQEPLSNITDSISSPAIATNVANVMKQNNTSTNLVRSITLQTFTLTITAPAGQTFNFLQNAQVYIFNDSLPPVEVAYVNSIPDTGSLLNMAVTNNELKPYLLANNFQLKIVGTSGKAVSAPVNVNIFLSFRFVADLLAVAGG